MIKDIKFNGYSAVPSDYECPDGSLAASLNLISEDGHIRPLFQPMPGITVLSNYRFMAIHNTPEFCHLILTDTNTGRLCYLPQTNTPDISSSPAEPTPILEFRASVRKVSPMGNMLIVSGVDSLHYFIFRDGQYVYLGNRVPDIKLLIVPESCSERESTKINAKAVFELPESRWLEAEYDTIAGFDSANTRHYIDAMMSCINRYIAQCNELCRFSIPFFIRYAIRLYDDTLINHSAPILIVPDPSDNMCPFVLRQHTKYNDSKCYAESASLQLMASAICLKMKAIAGDISNWKDIIRSVDIFFSRPVYPFIADPKPDEVFVWLHGAGEDTRLVLPPLRDHEAVMNDLCATSDFHLVKTITFDDILKGKFSDWSFLETESAWLDNLAVREAMSDDFHTHDTYAAQVAHIYNSRLNIGNISRNVFGGFPLHEMLSYWDREASDEGNGQYWQATTTDIITDIKIEGSISRVKVSSDMAVQPLCRFYDNHYQVQLPTTAPSTPTQSNGNMTVRPTGHWAENTRPGQSNTSNIDYTPNFVSAATPYWAWFYYPDSRASRMYITQHLEKRNADNLVLDSTDVTFEIPLKVHETLNGAYAIMPFHEIVASSNAAPVIPDVPVVEHLPNRIYLSQVDNPFAFPATLAASVGNGTVLAVSTAARPLSQGQFGQFPLYAFTDEGIWSLATNDVGSYSAVQPITRDVVTDPDSITQLDSSVLFITARGIMEISGSSTTCITDTILDETPFPLQSLPHIDVLHEKVKQHLPLSRMPNEPLSQFLNGCRMLYDYTRQHIWVCNPSYHYAYVFSAKSRDWGMAYSDIADTINSYPRALAVRNFVVVRDGVLVTLSQIVDFSDVDHTLTHSGLLVTRPIKLETPDVLKTIDTAIVRGNFAKGKVQTVLYGSRDLIHWHPVWSSKDHYLRGFRGTPYKYFRIACIADLAEGESLFGATLQFTPRYTDQPR